MSFQVISCAVIACISGCGAPSTAATQPVAQTPVAVPIAPAVVDADAGVAVEPQAPDPRLFQPRDVFELEFASDPQISPDGRHIVYVRNFMDIMKDARRSNLWIVGVDPNTAQDTHRPLTSGNRNVRSPRWSPDGKRLLYISDADGKVQLFVRWMDTGQSAKITNLTEAPGNIVWAPDGRWIAFTMRVPSQHKPMVAMPPKPKGAEWAPPPQVIDQMTYRVDGAGYIERGYSHLFVVPADGGTPRQLTQGEFHHRSRPSWAPDGRSILISANRHPGWELDPNNSEVYEVSMVTGAIRALTRRNGPDRQPAMSPDGAHIAYLGFDDKRQGYQVRKLYLMDRNGGNSRVLLPELDRSISDLMWSAASRGLYIQYDDHGMTKIGYVTRAGKLTDVTQDVGGTSLGRPYDSGSFTVARDGAIAYTVNRTDRPADIAVSGVRRTPVQLTQLNDDLFAHKAMAAVEEMWFESSFDRRRIQGWIVKPPGFDPASKYPLILEIHGGPFANYGPRYSSEMQLYASAGYVVVYINPRGSSSYGEQFGNLIHHNYPGQDYDDLMSGVDEVIRRGYVDRDQLYVTGGSGGGVLTSWIVGKTDRFRAAVVAKPVINWYSFVLTADFANFFYQYWFPGYPWDHVEHYHKRSPISLVGNVTTPTMVLTGDADYRTPMSESEQYYQALKLRQIDTALVRIPGASHFIVLRPSQLIAKHLYIVAWFRKYREAQRAASPTGNRSEAP